MVKHRCAESPEPISRDVREFEVLVKDTPRGITNFTIDQFPGRRTVVTTLATVEVNVVVYVYKFEFHGSETWIDGRMQHFENWGSDGGKPYKMTGRFFPDRAELVFNDKAISAPALAMTANYWRLPTLNPGDQTFTIVDGSTTTIQRFKIARGAEGQMKVGETLIPCTEYRLSGDVDVKVWLDREGLIVRQQSIESGYPTELRLKRIVKIPAAAARHEVPPPTQPR